jgi:hypothetical protein
MKMHFAALTFTAAIALATAASAADEIPVSRVVLSTSGLAHFELHAKVDGNTQLEFPVRLEQVDDILKSLTVFDAKGRIGGVTLPGKQPLDQIFRDLPFTQQQLENPMLLLNAYQGAPVSFKGAGAEGTGRIVSVVPEETKLDDGRTTTRHRLTVMTDTGLRQAVLEDLQSLTFGDEKQRAEIFRALDAIRENGASGKRNLTVNLLGGGARDVALSYVVDAPLWKTAYRMVMPAANSKDEAKGLLQGWAVIENMTASDWKDVDLTLVSGNPVTYRQSLYESYYVQRPEIPVQVFGRVMPRVDQGGIAGGAVAESAAMDMDAASPRMMMKAQRAEAPTANFAGLASAPPMPALAAMDTMAMGANAAQTSESTTQVLFNFPDKFSLKAGQSMMVPFVSKDMQMDRVSLYQPETHATHPLAAVELKNDGDAGLPPGILTLFEESESMKGTTFVGDAQLAVLPAGESRMVSYALDSKTTVHRNEKSTSVEDRIAISQGVMRSSTVQRSETAYTVKAPAKESRTVVIEHPKMGDYKLITPDPKDAETTDTHYRIRVTLKAGETKTETVVLERQLWQTYALADLSLYDLQSFAAARGKLDAGTRKVFVKLAELRRAIDAIDQQVNELDRRRNAIFQDQERVRQNLEALSEKSDVKDKYLDKLNAQEDEIGSIDKQKDKLAAERAERLKALQDEIADIKI